MTKDDATLKSTLGCNKDSWPLVVFLALVFCLSSIKHRIRIEIWEK